MLDLLEIFRALAFIAAYISTGNSFPEQLSSDEEKKALIAVSKGDETAKNTLIKHNLRLVAHIAKKYNGGYYDFDDLVSIGTIGLIKAVNTFDATKAKTLASYASKCVQNEILMSIRSSKKCRSESSLSDPIGVDKEGNEITLADVMGTQPESVYETVELNLNVQKLKEQISARLCPREQIVVTLRYGLNGNAPMPQREVANRLSISRSYVYKHAYCK